MHPILHRIITRRNVAIIIALIIFATIVGYVGEVQMLADWLKSEFMRLVGYSTIAAGAVFVVLAMISEILSFFTSTPLVPVAIALWGKTITLCLLFGGWFLGACLGYYIAYSASHLLKNFRIFKKINHYREQLGDSSEFALMLLFRLAVPSEIGILTLGFLRYSFWRHLIIIFIADLPFAILAIYSSTALVGPHPIVFALLMIVGLVAMSTFVYFFHRKIKQVRGVIIEAEHTSDTV